MWMVIDSFVCSLAGWQAVKTHSRVGINEREIERERDEDLVPTQGITVLRWSKHTLTSRARTHTNTQTEGSSVRSLSFHADLLSLSNVWYAGIQALLNDLISMGLPRHRSVCMCVSVYVCVCACVFICLRAFPLDKARDLARQTDKDWDWSSQ